MATTAQQTVPSYTQADFDRISGSLDDDQYLQFQSLSQKQRRFFLEQAPMDVLVNIQMRQQGTLTPPPVSSMPPSLQGRKSLGTPTGATRQEFLEGKGFTGTGLEEFGPIKDEGYDYSGLPNMALRAGLSLMETKREKENFLEKNIGPGSYTTDSQGRYAIMPNFREKVGAPVGDLPLIIDAPDSGFDEIGGDIADVAGMAPETISGVGAGMATSGYGAIPAAVAGALAGAAGQAVEEGVETLGGYQLQSLPEVAEDVSTEALYGFGGELFGRALSMGGKMLFSPGEVRVPLEERGLFGLQKYGYTPRAGEETQPIVRELLDEGAIPDPYMATQRELLGRFSGLVNRVFGYNRVRDAANRRWLQTGKRDNLDAVGAGETNPLTRYDLLQDEQVGNLIQQSRNNALSEAETSLANVQAQIKSSTDAALARLRTDTGPEVPQLGQDLINQIVRSKDMFSEAVGKLYNEADSLFGGRTIPTNRLQSTARQIYNSFPKEADGTISKLVPGEIQTYLKSLMKMPDYVTAQEMDGLRQLIGALEYSPELLGSVKTMQLGKLKRSIDAGFDDAIESNVRAQKGVMVDEAGNLTYLDEVVTPLGPEEAARLELGVKKLKAARAAYNEGMTRFDNVVVGRLAKQSGKSGSIEADAVLPYVIKNNNPSNLAFYLKALPDDGARNLAKQQLGRGYFEQELARAVIPETGEISARRLLTSFKNLGKTGRALYGDQYTNIMGQLQQLSRAQAKLTPELIEQIGDQPGAIPELLRKQFQVQQEADALIKDTWSKKVGDMGSPEIMDWLVRKASIKELREARDFFGPDSTEFKQIQQRGMQNILDNMFARSPENPVESVIDGRALRDALDEIGMPKLRELFNEDIAQGLQNYAKKAAFLTTKPKGLSGGLVAASIALNPLQNVGTLVRLKVLGQLFSSPTTLRWLTTIVENPGSRAAARAATRLGGQVMTQLSSEQEGAVDPEAMQQSQLLIDNFMNQMGVQ